MDRPKSRGVVRSDRIRRVAYAAVSAVAALTIAWRVTCWMVGSPTDAAVVMGCVAVWMVVRMDVTLGERGSDK